MGLLLIDEDGAHVRRERERFVVSRGAVDLVSVRIADVDGIVICGRVEATSGALDLAMSRRIPVSFLTSAGRYRGTLLPVCHPGAGLRRRQYDCLADEAMRLELARAIVDAQIANQCTVVRRLGLRRSAPEFREALSALRELREVAGAVTSVEELRGVEGVASRHVFTAVGVAVDPRLGFSHRAVRAGSDPFNVVLDVLGGLLASTATGVLAAAHLDPFEGAMHGDSRGAPALALDLEDVYRPLLVTAVAVTVLSKQVVQARDFAALPDGTCQLTTNALTRVCRAYARACRREVRAPGARRPKSYLRHLALDARALAAWFRDPGEPYRPLVVK